MAKYYDGRTISHLKSRIFFYLFLIFVVWWRRYDGCQRRKENKSKTNNIKIHTRGKSKSEWKRFAQWCESEPIIIAIEIIHRKRSARTKTYTIFASVIYSMFDACVSGYSICNTFWCICVVMIFTFSLDYPSTASCTLAKPSILYIIKIIFRQNTIRKRSFLHFVCAWTVLCVHV